MSSVTTPSDNRWRGIDVKAALLAGVIAGIVDWLLSVAIYLLQGQGLWGAARMNASLLMGRDVIVEPATFDVTIVLVSIIVHFGLSLIYGLIIAWFVRNSDWTTGLIIGAAAGFVIYIFNFYLVAPLLYPWMIDMRGLVSTLIHPVFGVTAAAAYIWLRRRTRNRM
ncbi:MAG: hypothetical protein ACRECQ_03580 [Burkholderiaceae bacterium]